MTPFDFDEMSRLAHAQYIAPAEQVIELRRIADSLERIVSLYSAQRGHFNRIIDLPGGEG